jgi:hypothetical protein
VWVILVNKVGLRAELLGLETLGNYSEGLSYGHSGRPGQTTTKENGCLSWQLWKEGYREVGFIKQVYIGQLLVPHTMLKPYNGDAKMKSDVVLALKNVRI